MSEALVRFIPEGLLSKAFSLAVEEISGLWHFKEDLQSLARKLEMIEALLTDASSRQASSRAVELWLNSLQEVAYEADNLLDEFAYKLLRQKVELRKRDKVRTILSSSNPFTFRSKMARKIKKINLALDGVYQESSKIGLRPVKIMNNTTTAKLTSERMTGPFVDDSEIVGRSDDIEKLLNELKDDREDLSVIGIVGMAGQGKTTVAQVVYKNDMVVRHFEKRIWICVSSDFKVERILNEMVQSLVGTISELTNKEAIVRRLSNELRAKRFLLVLDDVWNEDVDLWDCMRMCLQGIGGSKGSKIIVTTRSQRVISTTQTSFIHHLDKLSDDDSWILFEKIAFGHGGAPKTPELMDIGKSIITRCVGVPLAIKVIGGIMYTKKDEREWSKIEESEIWVSIDVAQRVLSAIKLSYDHLPSASLKQCFAFCSMFERGSIIDSDDLIQLWMAQGSLNPSKECQLEREDIGNNYLNVFLRSSLLQVAEKDEYGNVKSCSMHDLVYDFALQAFNDYSCIVEDGIIANDAIKALHLSIYGLERQTLITSRETLKKLRSLFLVGRTLEDALEHCTSLRVLSLVDINAKELPKTIVGLKHLRYLDISFTSIRRLPNCITKLYNLQTLRLHDLQELPKGFDHLINLRHIYIAEEGGDHDKKCLFPKLGKLTSLQTLPFFVVSQQKGCNIEELGPLNHLKCKLKVFGLENVSSSEEAMKANLSRKMDLDSLELHWISIWVISDRDVSEDNDVLEGLKPHSNLKSLRIVNYMGTNVPSWMLNTNHPLLLRNLVNIQLENFYFCEQVPPLGHLPHLKIVKMIRMTSVKSIGVEFYGCSYLDGARNNSNGSVIVFPVLKELIVKDMRELEIWSGLEGDHDMSQKVFPCLEVLEVENCPKLTCLPNIWSNLNSLRHLFIEMMDNLSHIPEELGGLLSLEELKISTCPNIVSIPIIQALTCLQELEIRRCDNLCALPRGTEVLTSLNDLTIVDCSVLHIDDHVFDFCPIGLKGLSLGGFSEDLDHFPLPNCRISSSSNMTDDDNNEIQHPLFVSLEVLILCGWLKLTSLPEQISHFSALKLLQIWKFHNIETLPEWLGNIRSLEYLWIQNCSSLTYLPSAEALQRLTKLRQLKIIECPHLEQRCKMGWGSEWHKIAHIPEIETTDEHIQDTDLLQEFFSSLAL